MLPPVPVLMSSVIVNVQLPDAARLPPFIVNLEGVKVDPDPGSFSGEKKKVLPAPHDPAAGVAEAVRNTVSNSVVNDIAVAVDVVLLLVMVYS